jgi:HMG (high mobility group) box
MVQVKKVSKVPKSVVAAKKTLAAHKKKMLKNKLLKGKKTTETRKTIRPGSIFEGVHALWSQMSAHKRKVWTQVGEGLSDNTAEPKRIRKSLEPKVVKPKKPMTSYVLFGHENYNRVKSEHPDLKMTEITRHLAQLWNNLTQAEKDAFNERKVMNTNVKVSHKMDPAEKELRARNRRALKAVPA